mgnify:CR=1 FL=1
MKKLLFKIDDTLGRITETVTSLLMLIVVLVVLYSVLMRYVFNHPPFWTDRISIFANVGMILMGLSLTVRNGDLISMQALYEKISPMFALILDATWNVIILVFSLAFAWYGLEAAMIMPGQYWDFQDFCIDLGYTDGDDGNIVFRLFRTVEDVVGYAIRPFCVDGAVPQKYLAMLMPVSGVLLVISSLSVVVRDIVKIQDLREKLTN